MESYFWQDQEVEFWHLQQDILLKKGRTVFMWCDSTFCTPYDWNTTRQTRYDLFQRKEPEQTFSCFRSEPQKSEMEFRLPLGLQKDSLGTMHHGGCQVV